MNDQRHDDSMTDDTTRDDPLARPARHGKRRLLIVGTVAAATLAIGGLAIAKAGFGSGRMGEFMIERASDRLELDDSQRASLGTLVEVMTRTGQTLRGDGPRVEMQRLTAGPTFDQGEALALIESRADALRAAAPDIVAAMGAFHDGLDERQRAEMAQLLERGPRHGFGHGRD